MIVRRDICAWLRFTQMNRRPSILSIVRRAFLALGGWPCRTSALVWVIAAAASALHGAEQPHIDLIEWYPRFPNQVTLHFGTTADHTYTLQYLDRIATNAVITNSSTWGSWSNLYVAEKLPFPTHYVIVDTATNSRQRFYRLKVTP